MKYLMSHRPERAHARGLSISPLQQPLASLSNPIWTVVSSPDSLWLQKAAIPKSFETGKTTPCRLTHSQNRAVRRG